MTIPPSGDDSGSRVDATRAAPVAQRRRGRIPRRNATLKSAGRPSMSESGARFTGVRAAPGKPQDLRFFPPGMHAMA